MEKRFVFRGNAVGAAGHIHRPEDLVIWVQGASSLPVVGGYARSATTDRAKFGDVLSIDFAQTRATGDYSDTEKVFKTLTNSVVQGLNVSNRLTADVLEATLSATHQEDGSEPSILSTGTDILKMKLDGYDVTMKIDNDLFNQYSTRTRLSDAYSSDEGGFYKNHSKRFQVSEKAKKPTKRQIPEVNGYIVTSIVSDVQTQHPKAVVDGHVITLNGFGRIFLGEFLITAVSRRLTLLRLKLGSPVAGDIACAEVESNGIIMF